MIQAELTDCSKEKIIRFNRESVGWERARPPDKLVV